MFEELDDIIIENANNTIKSVYEKFQNSSILSFVSKEEILERDFDNMFIFEDFFDEYLIENRDIDNFKEELIKDIVDLIEINEGNITIQELYEILTTPEETQEEVVKENTDDKCIKVKDLKLESDYELEYGHGHRIDFDNVEDLENLNKRISKDMKIDNMNLNLLFKPKSKTKSYLKNDIRTKTIGDSIEQWSLLKKNN